MKTIIAGSRTCTSMDVLHKAIKLHKYPITTVLCGLARGADALGQRYAIENEIPILYYPALWDKYGKSAGYIRNKEMAKDADALIALWDGESRGTKHMIDLAKTYNLHTLVYTPNQIFQ